MGSIDHDLWLLSDDQRVSKMFTVRVQPSAVAFTSPSILLSVITLTVTVTDPTLGSKPWLTYVPG